MRLTIPVMLAVLVCGCDCTTATNSPQTKTHEIECQSVEVFFHPHNVIEHVITLKGGGTVKFKSWQNDKQAALLNIVQPGRKYVLTYLFEKRPHAVNVTFEVSNVERVD